MSDNGNKIISQHIFMFPFRIKRKSNGDKIIEEFIHDIQNGNWDYLPYNIKDAVDYSEYVYFHDFVRDAIFEPRDIEKIKKDKYDFTSCYFEPKKTKEKYPEDKGNMIIYLKGGKEYTLTVDHVSLRLFETEIGILTIELLNYKSDTCLQDVLLINDFGRRIYPQFLSVEGIETTKDAFLANKIIFTYRRINSEEPFRFENFFSPIQNSLNNLQEHAATIPADYIVALIGKNVFEKYEVMPVIDDRMYTVSWFGSDSNSRRLSQYSKSSGKFAYETNGDWCRYIFIDGKYPGHANRNMNAELIEAATYKGWIENGTLFGITRYSLVCLTSSSDFSYEVIRLHMERQYFQIALILLSQRASLLKFANDISHVSKNIRSFSNEDKGDIENIATEVERLHASYIKFISKLWFTEVTPLEQGIVMYNMAVKAMGLTEQINELKSEIKELYEFIEAVSAKLHVLEDKGINRRLYSLTIVTLYFLPITAVIGFWGMNLYFISKLIPDNLQNLPKSTVILSVSGSFLLFIVSIIISYLFANHIFNDLETNKNSNNFMNFKAVFENISRPKTLTLLVIFVILWCALLFLA